MGSWLIPSYDGPMYIAHYKQEWSYVKSTDVLISTLCIHGKCEVKSRYIDRHIMHVQ